VASATSASSRGRGRGPASSTVTCDPNRRYIPADSSPTVGCGSESAFGRAFRLTTGSTPARLRRAARARDRGATVGSGHPMPDGDLALSGDTRGLLGSGVVQPDPVVISPHTSATEAVPRPAASQTAPRRCLISQSGM